MSDQPRVSFLIAAYNEERFVVECVNTCLEQSYPTIEVCVTDDGSNDRTTEVLQQAFGGDPRVKLARFDENRGKVHAFNRCYELATGSYIAIMGADDVCTPDRIEKTMAPLLANPDIAMSFCDLQVVDESLNEIHPSIYRMLDRAEALADPQTDFSTQLATSPMISGGGVTLAPFVKDHIFPIPETLRVEDWWISFVAAFFGRLHYVDEALVRYRQHSGNDNGAIHGIFDDYRTRVKLTARHPAIFAAFIEFLERQGSTEHLHLIAVEKLINDLVQLKRLAERKALTQSFMQTPYAEQLTAIEHKRIKRYTRFGRRPMLLSVIRKHLTGWKSC